MKRRSEEEGDKDQGGLSCDLTHTLCVAGPGIVRRTDGEGAQHGNQTRCVTYR